MKKLTIFVIIFAVSQALNAEHCDWPTGPYIASVQCFWDDGTSSKVYDDKSVTVPCNYKFAEGCYFAADTNNKAIEYCKQKAPTGKKLAKVGTKCGNTDWDYYTLPSQYEAAP